KGIHQLAKMGPVQSDGHGVDGEIPSFLIVIQAAVFYNGFAGIISVGFLPRADEFDLQVFITEHGGAEVFENRHLAAGLFADFPGEFDAIAHNEDVHVFRRTFEKQVPDKATYYVNFLPGLRSRFCNKSKYRMCKVVLHPGKNKKPGRYSILLLANERIFTGRTEPDDGGRF